ncbi:Acetate kinase [Paracholeplasma brassicae]|uniref:Acetate kinase n=1 Tax=Acholeplasma brassicae TaxID=61635 RepID=U4KNQ2_9MOLU|nr:acetate kinase [Paracholeplasma brassicae]CCV65997.1 Acetate kinase [Paracholeplasma brassicae]
MKIMAVNAGSSSIKFQLLDMPSEKQITTGIVERIGSDNASFTIKFDGQKYQKTTSILNHGVGVSIILEALIEHGVLSSINEIEGVGHRVVQGGEVFKSSVVINDQVLQQIIDLGDMAPLHNPANATGIKAFREILPNVIQVAVFDTTFHQTMKEDAFLYGTPYEWYTKYGIRKYGFHGTSHQFVSERANELLGSNDTKLIVCHIGNGASLSAVKNGQCVDTSMGFTPLEGFPMGTRSGSIDPAITSYMEKKLNVSSDRITDILNKESGYLGISGISNDSRDLENAILEGNERARLALDVQAKQIVDYIGSYYVYMGGLDAICFTAGIGENSAILRKMIADRLGVLGVELDERMNQLRGENLISTANSKVKVYVIPTDEEVMIAREVMSLQK